MGTPQELKLSTAYKTVRRKFCQSILRWSGDDSVREEVKSPNPPDVGDLVNILRSIGFKLRQFDKCEHRTEYSMSTSTSSLNSFADGLKNAECRVEITCGHSGLRAILESVVGECRCPPIESAAQAEFWQVSGSAPVAQGSQESISSVQEAGSSLVPPLAPAVAAAVKDIMIRVLQITSDPDFGELDTSRHSLAGNIQPNLSHHRSLDILPLTNSSTKQFGSTTETVESAEQDNKKLLPRTVSSVELSTCSVSPVSRSDSTGDLMKLHETWDTTTRRQSYSPTSILSASLERLSLTDKHGIFCRLEFAKRSINEAMSMLKVQPLPVDTTCKKVRQDNTSTPSSHARKSGQLKKTPGTPGPIMKTPGTPGIIKKTSGTPGIIKKMPGTTGLMKKTPGSSGPTKKISGTTGAIKKTSAIPGPSSSVTQIQASTSVEYLISETAESPLPHGSKLSVALSRPRKKPSPQQTIKSVSSRFVKNSQKLDVPSCDAIVHTPNSIGTNISTGSSSSASSASSTKARKLINAVRRVSRISSSGGTPNSKSSQRENN